MIPNDGMLTIRSYHEGDAVSVGILIADTYSKFNLSDFTPKQRDAMLGLAIYSIIQRRRAKA
jgi:hypothetical protein